MTERSWNPEVNQSLGGKNTVDRDSEDSIRGCLIERSKEINRCM